MTSNAYSPPGFMGLFVIGCAMANQSPQTEPPDLQKQDSYQNEDQLQQDSGQTDLNNQEECQLEKVSWRTLRSQKRKRQCDCENYKYQYENQPLQQESRQRSCQNQLRPEHPQDSSLQCYQQFYGSTDGQSTQISTTEQLFQGIRKLFWKRASQNLLLSQNFVQNDNQEKQLQQGYHNRLKNGFATTENIQTQAQVNEDDVQQLKHDQTTGQQQSHVQWTQMMDQVQMPFQDYQQHSQSTEPTQSQVSRQSGVPVQGYVQFRTPPIMQSLQTSTTESVTDICNYKLPGTSWMGHGMAVLAY